MSKFIGIDISKQTFDVCFSNGEHEVCQNTQKGFMKLLKKVDEQTSVIMEASGPYYLPLADFLWEHKVKVYVENPLRIKRFSQMEFNRAKTDKKDAKVIRDFGVLMESELKQWQPESESVRTLKQLHSAVELLNKQIAQTERQLESFEDSGFVCKTIKKNYKSLLLKLKKQKLLLEKEMDTICKTEYKETFESLTSIPGIGAKTAIMLIAITDNFEKFESYKQLIAYVGFSPRIYQSGTSVKGKGHICKMGKSQMRKLLYLCAWSAKFCNQACAQMYQRLREKGKPERVIKVAIANKLIKQSFAIVKNKLIYQKNFTQNICF